MFKISARGDDENFRGPDVYRWSLRCQIKNDMHPTTGPSASSYGLAYNRCDDISITPQSLTIAGPDPHKNSCECPFRCRNSSRSGVKVIDAMEDLCSRSVGCAPVCMGLVAGSSLQLCLRRSSSDRIKSTAAVLERLGKCASRTSLDTTGPRKNFSVLPAAFPVRALCAAFSFWVESLAVASCQHLSAHTCCAPSVPLPISAVWPAAASVDWKLHLCLFSSGD